MQEEQLLNALCRTSVDLQRQAIFQSIKAKKLYYTYVYIHAHEHTYIRVHNSINFFFSNSNSFDKNQQPNISLGSLTIYQKRSAPKDIIEEKTYAASHFEYVLNY